jgi:phospholipase C
MYAQFLRLAVSALGPALLSLTAFAHEAPKPVPGLEKIKHIIVIYLENRSFDHLYGLFPGANGIKDAGVAATQVDRDGAPYEKLPAVMNTKFKPPIPDTRFPFDLPNGPF